MTRGSAPGAGLDPEDARLLDRVARWVALRRMTSPAILFLESAKPLSFVGSQIMVFFEPFVRAFLTAESYSRFASLLENRDNVEELVRRIESADDAVRRERSGETGSSGSGDDRSRETGRHQT